MQITKRFSGTTWLVALALIVTLTASQSTWFNLSILVISFTVVIAVALANRQWSQLRLLLLVSLGILLVRVVFRILFGSGGGETYLVWLPTLQLDLGLGQLRFLGPINTQALTQAVFDASRLASIVAVVTATNLITDVRGLLRRAPGALFEISTSVSLALSFVPQLAQSISRIRQSARLRGHSRSLGFAAIAVPVFEDAFDRALQLAASMDVRGYGHRKPTSPRQAAAGRMTSVLALLLLALALGELLFGTDLAATLLPLVIGLGFMALAVALESKQRLATRFDRAGFVSRSSQDCGREADESSQDA